MWQEPKTNWNATQQGVGDDDFNRIEGNALHNYNYNSISDFEGNKYGVVQIGGQLWTTENLRSTKYQDGTAIPIITDDTEWAAATSNAYCRYDNEKEVGGYLYNGYVVDSNQTKSLAPTGWRVPTKADVESMLEHLAVGGYNYNDTSTTGDYSKISRSISSQFKWDYSAVVGAPGGDGIENNLSGLGLFPGGARGSLIPSFVFFGEQSNIWTQTDYITTPTQLNYLRVVYNSAGAALFPTERFSGLAVRLVKDIV